MKITGGEVIDLRLEGTFRDPIFRLSVDEPVDEIAQPVTYQNRTHGDNWRLVPCGPFVAVERRVRHEGETVWTTDVNVGSFNVRGLHSEQLLAVQVVDPELVLDLQLPVKRAMRLLRRFGLDDEGWDIKVDQEAAINGHLNWYLTNRVPLCFGDTEHPKPQYCMRPVMSHVVYQRTHLPLCAKHWARHQNMIRNLRISSRAS